MKNDISIQHFESIDSTNNAARRLVASGSVKKPTLITASTQTAGKGRMGRSFYSPDKTGIYMSLVFKADAFSEAITRVTTAAAVSVHEIIGKYASIEAQIKWVNDIYIDGKKVCGILCESVLDNIGDRYVIAGIGVNLNTREFPDGLRAPAGSVFDGLEALPNSLASSMALDIADRLLDKLAGGDTAVDLDTYRRNSYLDGKRIVCTVGNRSFEGVALGIGDDFSLCVLTDNGETVNLSGGEATVKVM